MVIDLAFSSRHGSLVHLLLLLRSSSYDMLQLLVVRFHRLTSALAGLV